MNNGFNLDDLIGKTEPEGKELCGWNGLLFRVSKRDDIQYILIKDLRMDRVTVVIENEKIVSYKLG